MAAYFLYINATSWESDSDCSRLVCSSQAETEAGISYYQKILRRNVLLRRLLGKEMEYYIQVCKVFYHQRFLFLRLSNICITLSKEFSLARLQSSCFQESGEYVPLLYEMEYFRNISTKIKTLQDLGEELASEKSEENVVNSTNTDSSE